MAQSSTVAVGGGTGVTSKGWKKIKSMSVPQLMEKLLQEKAALELYSQEVTTSQKVITQLVGCLGAVRAKRQALMGQPTAKKSETSTSNAVLRKELEEAKRQLKEAKSLLEQKEKQLVERKKEIEELEKSSKDKEEMIKGLKENVTNLQSQVNDQKTQIDDLQKTVADYDMTKEEVADLKSQMAIVLKHLSMRK